MLNSQLTRNHRDELAIDRITEQTADAVDVAACPSDFNRVANSAFDAGWRRLILLSDCRIQRLRNRTEDLDVVVHHRDRFAQILVTLYMGRYPDFMDYRRYIRIQVLALGHRNYIVFV